MFVEQDHIVKQHLLQKNSKDGEDKSDGRDNAKEILAEDKCV